MTDTEKQKRYRVIVDCWRFFLKYHEPVEAEEYWLRLTEESSQIAERYGHTKFAENMLLAMLEEIDRIWAEKKERRSVHALDSSRKQ